MILHLKLTLHAYKQTLNNYGFEKSLVVMSILYEEPHKKTLKKLLLSFVML